MAKKTKVGTTDRIQESNLLEDEEEAVVALQEGQGSISNLLNNSLLYRRILSLKHQKNGDPQEKVKIERRYQKL